MTPTPRALFAAKVLNECSMYGGTPFGGGGELCADEVADGLVGGTLTLPTELESFDLDDGWISVEERLPENASDVIACDSKGTIHPDAAYITGHWCNDERYLYDVTHWQPLPPAPKGAPADEAE